MLGGDKALLIIVSEVVCLLPWREGNSSDLANLYMGFGRLSHD